MTIGLVGQRVRPSVSPDAVVIVPGIMGSTLETESGVVWYLNGLVRCRAVAQIQDTSANGIGTGFLVRGADLHPALPDQVLVTNGHVIPEDLHPADAVVVFHGRHRRRAQRGR